MKIKNGDKVKIEYTGKLEDGTVFDSSEKYGKPLEIEVGAKKLIKGFEDALIGMEENEEKEVTINPEDAYGQPNLQLRKKVPRGRLPKEPEPKKGMVLLIGTPDGRQFPAKIIEISENEVSLDLNHPLAGKTLIFKIKVVGINN
ncbi:MAG: peptidylprolyl isomerase [Nanoarchaeota archaeon]|nr:peptidylprolyl isomerase [Nanoarchaeota archaeon]